MKILAVLMTLSLGTPVFADFQAAVADKEVTFKGGGMWKSIAGKRGRYTAINTYKSVLDENGETTNKIRVSTKTVVYFDGEVVEEMEVSTVMVFDENKFYTVRAGGEKIGSGYCFGSTCHNYVRGESGMMEETFHFHKGKIMVLGSWRDADGRGAWKGTLDKVED